MKMKKFGLTFLIFFIVEVIIAGIFNVARGMSFITQRSLISSLIAASVYLLFLFIFSRKHILTALIICLCVAVSVLIILVAKNGISSLIELSVLTIINCFYVYTEIFVAAFHQNKIQ